MTAAGVTPDHSGRKEAEVPPAEIKLFALAFIYFILMFIAISVFSQTTPACHGGGGVRCAGSARGSGAVWAAGSGARMAAGVAGGIAGAGGIVLPVSAAGGGATTSWHQPQAGGETDWKPRAPYVWVVGWRWRR